MKKNLLFIFINFLLFYLSLSLFLHDKQGLLLPAFYINKFLKYLIGDLRYLVFLLFFVNLFIYEKGFKDIAKYKFNILLFFLAFILPFSYFFSFGILSVVKDFSFLVICLILLILLYINYNYIYNLFNKKAQKKNLDSKEENVKVVKEDKVERKIESEKIEKEDESKILNSLDDEKIKIINVNKILQDEEEKEKQIELKKEEIKVEKLEKIESIKPEKEISSQGKKVQILSELEENKAILNELELGVNEKPKDFVLPSIDLLSKDLSDEIVINEDEIDQKISELLAKLRNFKIVGDVEKTYSGPVVTTFEFKPAADVKLSKISSLSDDLAMALKATSIRIQAPIPGKDVVGIEIPNQKTQTIYISSIFSDSLFINSKSKLTLALGKDIVGNTFITDLKKLPHLLIAGTTGSGKSVGINAMILSLLFKNTPRTLRLLMIDPKMLEFSMYNDIPHLLTPVITKAEKATIALRNMVNEMERRYTLMSAMQTKDIETYNQKASKLGAENFAYIVIIIDELADLMMTCGKEVELYIARLAQMARACGIHLIVATQRPSVDVITGLIKANLPSRLSYKVSTQTDSKVILDTKGAESLLGRGDCLFTPPGTSSIIRLHAPFASEEDILRVVEHLKQQEAVEYDDSILQDSTTFTSTKAQSDNQEKDELYDEALKLMLEDDKTSISYLQRRLSIGYNRAANIIEQAEANGFLSAPNAKGIRTIIKE
ncbi:DNA translocase FtsK [Campylobacter canadensis]|uniref:DNA translocase FtsK n=1 Tax=Campylobacter canadensis TaxID=449520 RepID=UPI0015538B52|nr:DNA translocase FtsK [Campylobacter canadensis]MBZ7995512.1 DNA translocase FtsK [Campylobacter canadensis]MBZ7997329.1 DNA translocase FtsK [Campylobacter canadensis]MBZ8000876.1 DNA translocase FtsK [Campylobacter canadensis]MBZ8002676.1 DNA translocase FtsK [Campylobacter canadensis]MBZ8003515.1 DNA translocase FtsK [Campylobacter canadensis]